MNTFNSTIIRAMRCNMDIKFLGSGPSTKAIIYYITDYITKSQLKTHVAYAAIQVAINGLQHADNDVDDVAGCAKKLLQKCAFSMVSKQELSSQQVVSYLRGYKDHFTSHTYCKLFWMTGKQRTLFNFASSGSQQRNAPYRIAGIDSFQQSWLKTSLRSRRMRYNISSAIGVRLWIWPASLRIEDVSIRQKAIIKETRPFKISLIRTAVAAE